MYVGFDIGSVALKVVVLDDEGRVVETHYIRTHGQPLEHAHKMLNDLLERYEISVLAATGYGGKKFAEILGIPFANEIVAHATAVGFLHPDARTVIEIGGEDSKLIKIETDQESGHVRIRDIRMNTLCAAGTGSFLDQQAARLGVSIEEFGKMALKCEHPPRIAGRCSVFAKTDMIHLQQQATPVEAIIAGLCFAMVRNYVSSIAKRGDFEQPIVFVGGVAANAGIRRAFEEILSAPIIVPEHHAQTGAIGAVLPFLKNAEKHSKPEPQKLTQYLKSRKIEVKYLDPLPKQDYPYRVETVKLDTKPGEKVDVWVGIDIGSISTNVVVIDRQKRVLARRYLMTAGRPIEAVKKGLYEVGQEIGDRVKVLGVCTTGSGRYLIADVVGGDIVKNEITAHATGAYHMDPEVDTIFEIGGQDSKYISMDHGAIVDFMMNKVCAAGTGSFLEEQAEKLGVSIKDEFSQIALSAEKPADLGERCTVFMETQLNHLMQQGVPKESLISGLCYSIVYNYLNKVVEFRRVGERIFFQGGTAYNRGVKAAFEKVLGKKVEVPPQHDVLGAYGAAIIALQELPNGPSKFKGFDLRDMKYRIETFECTDCPNRCEINKVTIEGEEPLYYGSRCGKYDIKRKKKGKGIPRLFKERERMLIDEAYPKDKPDNPNGKKVGLPRVSLFFEYCPFFKAFLTECGFEVVLSDATNRQTITRGLDTIQAEFCFPIKVAHGHVMNLLEKGVDYVFLPCVVNTPPLVEGMERSYNCVYVQALPYILRSAIDFAKYGAKPLIPVLHLEWNFKRWVERPLVEMAAEVGVPRGVAKRAVRIAWQAQKRFWRMLEERGKEVLASLKPDQKALVIVSRPYNGFDPGLNLNIPEKLRDMGVLAIPMDFLPLSEEVGVAQDYPHMYWKYGQRILAAARIIARDDRLYPIYISNFGCGPDSFIQKFTVKALEGKPCLFIEIDEHSADVGAITRLEAFLDSLKHARQKPVKKPRVAKLEFDLNRDRRVLWIPHMDDPGYALAAALRHFGVPARHMPLSDQQTLDLGRRYTSGKECYPCIITTGDMLKIVFDKQFDPRYHAFFMPDARGPCRFGQYNRFHRMLLDDLGYEDVVVVNLDQTSEWNEHLERIAQGFRRLAFRGIIVVDTMKKLLLERRPYEVEKGACDRLYWQLMAELEELLERGLMEEVMNFPKKVVREFNKIELDLTQKRPKVGIIGEIFVRSNEFANNFIVRRLEAVGAQVTMPSFEEWLNYIDYERRVDFRVMRQYGSWIKEQIVQFVANSDKRRIQKPFLGHIRCFAVEPPTTQLMALADRYMTEFIRGEATLSIAKAIEYYEHGYHGVVNLAPFQCLPSTSVNSILERFKRDFDNIPVLKMAYDGTQQAGEQMRIEAFVHQARQFMERRQMTRRSVLVP